MQLSNVRMLAELQRRHYLPSWHYSCQSREFCKSTSAPTVVALNVLPLTIWEAERI